MNEKPNLNVKLDSETFKEYYYLKEELVDFCRKNDLQSTGGKLELTERIANFLDTGERIYKTSTNRRATKIDEIKLDTKIEANIFIYNKNLAKGANKYGYVSKVKRLISIEEMKEEGKIKEYDHGFIIEIFGFEIYNNVK